jgi:hypothetical protein
MVEAAVTHRLLDRISPYSTFVSPCEANSLVTWPARNDWNSSSLIVLIRVVLALGLVHSS